MIIPELPEYLTNMGGGDYKGLIISLFTVTAMLSRPFSGALADKVGRVPVIMFGSVVCLICSMIYPVITSVTAFMWLRLMHGFSTGFTPTGQSAYLADVIPANRRGEAMGLLGTAGSIGMAGGPALGGMLSNHFGLNIVFYCSSVFAFISLLVLLRIRETVKHKQPFGVGVLKVSSKDWFEPRVIVPCIVMVLAVYAYGAVFTLLPDLGKHIGVKNKGLLFTYLTLSTLVIRLIGGKASDHFGRVPVLRVSTMAIIISMALLAFADNKLMLLAGVILYGMAHGATSPTLMAWATDLSDEHHKGRGIASLYIFMEMGIGLGAFISGWVYGNNNDRFMSTFLICSALALLAFLYLFSARSKKSGTLI